ECPELLPGSRIQAMHHLVAAADQNSPLYHSRRRVIRELPLPVYISPGDSMRSQVHGDHFVGERAVESHSTRDRRRSTRVSSRRNSEQLVPIAYADRAELLVTSRYVCHSVSYSRCAVNRPLSAKLPDEPAV